MFKNMLLKMAYINTQDEVDFPNIKYLKQINVRIWSLTFWSFPVQYRKLV